jgi:hypothetical protein
LALFYTRDVLETFFDIFEDLQEVLGAQGNTVASEWNTKVE